MSKKAWLAGLSILMLSLGIAAQTPDEDEDTVSPERKAMALDRSELAAGYGAPRGDYFGYHPSYEFGRRYMATGYARARRSSDLRMRLWNPRHQTVWITSGRRSFGRRGELFLMAPTFLAPVVPFNEHSFER
jgi:hypothetical protein